jgi:hypothetical protein
MASVNKLAVRGIRAFSPDDKEQVVEFYFPVTMIVGRCVFLLLSYSSLSFQVFLQESRSFWSISRSITGRTARSLPVSLLLYLAPY